jgi:acyl dehydratase
MLRLCRAALNKRQIKVGDSYSFTRKITEQDILRFAEISGDRNPIHVDRAAAQKAGFKAPIAHGMLVASLISNAMGVHLPGPQSVYMQQSLRFVKPCFADDEVRCEVEVLRFNRHKCMIELRTDIIRVEDGATLIQGKAMGLNKVVDLVGESPAYDDYKRGL